jgi:hypothetical protein
MGAIVTCAALGFTWMRDRQLGDPSELIRELEAQGSHTGQPDYALVHARSMAADAEAVRAQRWHPTGYAFRGAAGVMVGVSLLAFGLRARTV